MTGSGSQGVGLPRWLIALIVIVAIGLALYGLRGVLTPVFFAFLIAYMLDPVADWFEARRVPRALAIVILLTVVLGALALFIVLAVPGIVRDIAAFARDLPGQAERLLTTIEPYLAEQGIEVPHTLDEVLSELQVDEQMASKAIAPIGAVLGWIAGGTASLLGAIVALITVPVFAFYLLYDFDRMTAAARELVPWRVRPFVVEIAREIDGMLGQFIRGQLIVMFLLAVLYSVGYSVCGVRLAVPIGIVAGLLSFIPYVGGAVALGLALLMSVLDWGGWGQIGGVVAAYAVVQVLEGFVITPKIVGDKVGLSSIWVLFALMVGGELFGFMGVLLAVPAAAVAKIIVRRVIAYYRETDFYREGAPELVVAAQKFDDEEGLDELASGGPPEPPPAPEPPEAPPSEEPPTSSMDAPPEYGDDSKEAGPRPSGEDDASEPDQRSPSGGPVEE